ncbi:MAG: hypothetical protein Q9171_002647 [Xanthocarpia ochracea]
MASKQEAAFFVGLGELPPTVNPRVLIVILKAVLGFAASQLIRRQLHAIRNICEVTRTEGTEHESTQRSEDAIKLETLDELSRNANEDIRNAAIKIIIERASKSSSRRMLLGDLRSKDHERRGSAITSIKYLYQSVPECFDPYKNILVQSVVDCLSNLLPLSYQFETARMEGKEIHRTETERDAMELMYLFLQRFGVQVALECNILSLWLERYPFGGNLEIPYPGDKHSQLAAKHKIITGFSLSPEHDPAMYRILSTILREAAAPKTVFMKFMNGCSSGSCSCSKDQDGEPDENEQGFSEIWYKIHGTANAPDQGLGPMMRGGNRVRDESIEEQALRRRRREAMVLGEMGRPIEREDIIQREVI